MESIGSILGTTTELSAFGFAIRTILVGVLLWLRVRFCLTGPGASLRVMTSPFSG